MRISTSSAAIAALSALAQEHRLAAFRLLVEAGPEGLPAGTVAEHLGMPPSSLSFHLAHLERAGLVAKTRLGRTLIYSARFETVRGLSDYLLENCCGGRTCTDTAAPERLAKGA
ncbi:ArsR/SmtB family transcription factor [Sphingosinicella microcystinivorans]|uniref:Transcriptional regulator n=1 Tax=Sphingosinicella microcystinivorans TaxID=335406 RepID=A0AAD1D7Y9_SPHMI|nr:metalloregulator ArsR/SmtB family transcription factor [Sphingosinicella microcystinivorans]RKS91566.1 ArsR family transcriptional regulator [Sphingosinicella microcystinivorans]BBE34546.1 transcriptional regulator [Sphingosinicella microcystinivorans]